MYSELVPELGAAQETQQALSILAAHWRVIWDRPVSPQQSLEAVLPLSPAQETQTWEPLTGNQLRQSR